MNTTRLMVKYPWLLILAVALTCKGAPAPIPMELDVVYGNAAGTDLKCDIARPADGNGPFPAVLYFHGGGWQAGSKRDGHGWIRALAARGYVGVSVGYRFVPQFPWPAQVHDAKAAVRYVRAHAKELKVDPDRIVAMGDSAGAYLALMLGVTGPADGLEGEGGNPEVSSRVQAVISYYGGSDFTNMKPPAPDPEVDAIMKAYYHSTTAEVLANMFPSKDPADPIYVRMSVLTYVDKEDAPALIFQGDRDKFVPVEHAYKLDRALTAAQVPHELVIVKGGGHGFTPAQQEQTRQQSFEFLKQRLGPAESNAVPAAGGSGNTLELGVVYGRAGDTDLKLDLARPAAGPGPFPAIVYIHGGGWRMGDRAWGHGPIRALAAHGYVAVTISHRFAPEFKWPAQIHDVKAAVRYLRAHAKDLNIDPEHIGIIGESSGGHLALMAGLTGPADNLEGENGSPGVSSRVQAVVSYSCMTDLTGMKPQAPTNDAERKDFEAKRTIVVDFGGTDDPSDPVWAQLSPITYADAGDPPVLMFHGSADTVVPVEQAHRLDRALARVGADHRLYVAEGGGHAWKGPFREETNRQLLEFFDRHLKAGGGL